MPTAVTGSRRLPWTRRRALEAWSRSIGTLSMVATGAIALGAAFQGIPDAWEVTLLGLALVSALPLLWIGLTRLAEKRYLSRPPKRFLATALGFDFGGIALVATAVVLVQSETSDVRTMLTAGGVLEGCGTLLLLAWFLAVLAVEPGGDHMHSL
jgi:hypothetical protein